MSRSGTFVNVSQTEIRPRTTMRLAVLWAVAMLVYSVQAHSFMKCLRCDGEDCNTDRCQSEWCFLSEEDSNIAIDGFRRGCLEKKFFEDYEIDETFQGCREVTIEGTPRKICICSNGKYCNQGTMEECEEWIADEVLLNNGAVYYGHSHDHHDFKNISLNEELIRLAVEHAYEYLTLFNEDQHAFFNTGASTNPLVGSSKLAMLFSHGTPDAIVCANDGVLYNNLALQLSQLAHMDGETCACMEHLQLQPLKVCPYPHHDYIRKTCDFEAEYRTFDGKCNNKNYPSYGAAGFPFDRFVAPEYDNFIDHPRTKSAIPGKYLPNPRKISLALHHDATNEHVSEKFNVLIMQWGQFTDHDIDLTPFFGGEGGGGLECCSEYLPEEQQSYAGRSGRPECFPIPIYEDDPIYGPANITCLNFIRSIPAPSRNCVLGPRQQLNEITSFIDGSEVYGSDSKTADSLRSHEGGKMLTSDDGLGDANLPRDEENEQGCPIKEHSHHRCVFAGDIRVNEQVVLRTIHTLFVRYHNYVAKKLALENPDWNDEELYQTTRKIVGAVIQHITYNEWLPALFGDHGIEEFNLDLVKTGYFTEYDDTLNPSIRNEFAAAAFRFGHSFIPPAFKVLNYSLHEVAPDVSTSQTFFNPDMMNEVKTANCYLIGILNTKLPILDRRMTTEVTNLLFKVNDIGLDLGALNIQRARDHGIKGYNTYRRYCKGIYGTEKVNYKPAKNWEDLESSFDAETFAILQATYEHVDDIDLFSAAISEKHLQDSMMGPMLQCILGRQFKMLRQGDRFWYENHKAHTRFTRDQLTEIRKMTVARVLCDTMDGLEEVQPRAFELANDETNARQNCASIPGVDFSKWVLEDPEEWAEALKVDDRQHLITEEYRFSSDDDNYSGP